MGSEGEEKVVKKSKEMREREREREKSDLIESLCRELPKLGNPSPPYK